MINKKTANCDKIDSFCFYIGNFIKIFNSNIIFNFEVKTSNSNR